MVNIYFIPYIQYTSHTYNSIFFQLKNNIDVSCSMTKSKVTALGNGADTYSPPTINAWRQERWIVTGDETEMTSWENKHLGGTPQNNNNLFEKRKRWFGERPSNVYFLLQSLSDQRLYFRHGY